MKNARVGLAVVVMGVSTAVACSRTPPEPSPPAANVQSTGLTPESTRTGANAGAEAGPSLANRCIRATPAEAPPAASPAPAAQCPADPGPMKMAIGKVSFPDAPSAPHEMEVELANTNAESARGLMFRRSMPEDHGMLFDLHNRKVQTFWMHNTCIPLDMMFVDDDGLIVGILEQVPVLNDDERSVGCPSRYVLETNAGFARKHGIKAGQRLKLP